MNNQLAKAIAAAIASASLLAPLYATAQTSGTAPAGAAPGAATSVPSTPAPAMSSVERRATADAVPRADRRFAQDAALSDLAEIATSKLALQKSSSDSVKKYAQHMIDEHTKTSEQLKPMAQAKGIELPTAPDREHQRMLEKLQKESGDKFDREYMRGQVKDHEKAVRLFERQAKNGKDNEFKQFASTTLPNLREHLKMARDGQQAHRGGDRHMDRNSTGSSTSMNQQGGAAGASGATARGTGSAGGMGGTSGGMGAGGGTTGGASGGSMGGASGGSGGATSGK